MQGHRRGSSTGKPKLRLQAQPLARPRDRRASRPSLLNFHNVGNGEFIQTGADVLLSRTPGMDIAKFSTPISQKKNQNLRASFKPKNQVHKKPIEKDFAKEHGLPPWNPDPHPALLSPSATQKRRGSATGNYVFINAQKDYSIMHYSKGEKLTQALKSPKKGPSIQNTLKTGKTFESQSSFSPFSRSPLPTESNQYKKTDESEQVYPTTTNFLIRRCSHESLGEEGSCKEIHSHYHPGSPGDEVVTKQAGGFLDRSRHGKVKKQTTIAKFFDDGKYYRKGSPAETSNNEDGDDEEVGLLEPPFVRKSRRDIDNCVDNQSVITRQPKPQIKTFTKKDSMMLDIQNRWKFNQNQVKSIPRITDYGPRPNDSASKRRQGGRNTITGFGSADLFRKSSVKASPTITFASPAKKQRNFPPKTKNS